MFVQPRIHGPNLNQFMLLRSFCRHIWISLFLLPKQNLILDLDLPKKVNIVLQGVFWNGFSSPDCSETSFVKTNRNRFDSKLKQNGNIWFESDSWTLRLNEHITWKMFKMNPNLFDSLSLSNIQIFAITNMKGIWWQM